MKHRWTVSLGALGVAAGIGLAVAAQDGVLSGTVAEVFGPQLIVNTSDGRVLVEVPAELAVPQVGSRVSLEGQRDGDRFTASALTVIAVTDPAEAALPQALRGLGLSQLRSRPDDDGEVYWSARLPEGGFLRAETRGDQVLEIQGDDTGLPPQLVNALLPAGIAQGPWRTELERVTEIDFDDRELSVEGFDADGMRIELEFAPDGRLMDYERERDDRRSLSESAARQRLLELGYSDIGFIDRGRRSVEVLAVNPYGEVVEVRLDHQGRVDRERRWR